MRTCCQIGGGSQLGRITHHTAEATVCLRCRLKKWQGRIWMGLWSITAALINDKGNDNTTKQFWSTISSTGVSQPHKLPVFNSFIELFQFCPRRLWRSDSSDLLIFHAAMTDIANVHRQTLSTAWTTTNPSVKLKLCTSKPVTTTCDSYINFWLNGISIVNDAVGSVREYCEVCTALRWMLCGLYRELYLCGRIIEAVYMGLQVCIPFLSHYQCVWLHARLSLCGTLCPMLQDTHFSHTLFLSSIHFIWIIKTVFCSIVLDI